jgi:hypothetical protein
VDPEGKVVICLADTVATLQQPEFGLQQNDAEVTIRLTPVLQICQQCRNATSKALNSLASSRCAAGAAG